MIQSSPLSSYFDWMWFTISSITNLHGKKKETKKKKKKSRNVDVPTSSAVWTPGQDRISKQTARSFPFRLRVFDFWFDFWCLMIDFWCIFVLCVEGFCFPGLRSYDFEMTNKRDDVNKAIKSWYEHDDKARPTVEPQRRRDGGIIMKDLGS